MLSPDEKITQLITAGALLLPIFILHEPLTSCSLGSFLLLYSLFPCLSAFLALVTKSSGHRCFLIAIPAQSRAKMAAASQRLSSLQQDAHSADTITHRSTL